MKKYNHVSETLSYVDNFIKKNGPFDNITGYGQGGIILSIYLDRYPIILNKTKVIIISSYCPLDPQWSLINRTLRC